MNLVAHQLLSFNDTDAMIGNFLGDFVRGKSYQNYPKSIANGIVLHRFIDSYTDSHPIVKQSTRRLHKSQKKYAPVVVDLFYDYLLIKHWDCFYDTDFESFKQLCYANFKTHYADLDSSIQFVIEHIVEHDWFDNYASLKGVELTLVNMGKRRKFSNDMHLAVKELYLHENEFEQEFLAFFPSLMQESKDFLSQLNG